MPSKSRKKGNIAENAVAKYAEGNGWKILARNFEKPWGEIDIVARDKNILIFIEVKSGGRTEGFNPEDNFDQRKKQKVTRACLGYLAENDYPEYTDWRVDLAAVEMDFETRNARVRYYKNAIA
ncbi:MAG: YraN family protein [Candidatus Spechtbacterales bacterium]